MNYRSLGRTGVQVTPLCLGAMNFGGPTDEAESIAIIDRALDGGINFIDTANVYNAGESERIVGKALQQNGRRDEIVLATKVFGKMGDGPNEQGVTRYHIIKACEDSLRRLQTDRIDLYQLHRPSLTVPQDETLRAFDDLVRAGKVRYIGCSTFPAWKVMEALGVSREQQPGALRQRAAALQPAGPPHRERAGAAGTGARPGVAAVVAAGRRHPGRALCDQGRHPGRLARRAHQRDLPQPHHPARHRGGGGRGRRWPPSAS